jgi:hypothetical protein
VELLDVVERGALSILGKSDSYEEENVNFNPGLACSVASDFPLCPPMLLDKYPVDVFYSIAD